MADSIQRWCDAIARQYPNLPRPVVEAMAQGAAKGALGHPLNQISEALNRLEGLPLDNLTGSEARALLAVLRQMSGQIAALEAQLQRLWENP